MREYIEINNFGPINHVWIDDIKPLTILIGESGSGKSTLMKMMAIFRWIYKMTNIRAYLKFYSKIKRSPFKINFHVMIKRDGLMDYLRNDTFMRYGRGECEMLYQNGKFRIVKGKSPQKELNLEKISFISEKRNIIPDYMEHNVSINQKAFYLKEVWSDYQEATESIKNLDMPFVDVRFKEEKKGGSIKHKISSTESNGRYSVDLQDASSGIQFSTPLSLIVEYFSKEYDLVKAMNKMVYSYLSEQDSFGDFKGELNIGDFPNKRVNILIEEPELGLYPENQVGLMDFLVERCFMRKQQDYGITLTLSTHSPFIVNYLNVLLLRNASEIHVSKEQLAVYRVFEGGLQDLVMRDCDGNVVSVDTRDLSEAMQSMYSEYLDRKNTAV